MLSSLELWKPPEIVIEIVSNSVGGELAEKYQIYEHMRVSYYVVYDPNQQLSDRPLRIYELRGQRYGELEEPWLDPLGLGLTLWRGTFEERQDVWLRWCDRWGALLLTGDEQAGQERQRAEQERQRAERAEHIQRAVIAQLLSMGMAPEQVAETLGLSSQDIESIAQP